MAENQAGKLNKKMMKNIKKTKEFGARRPLHLSPEEQDGTFVVKPVVPGHWSSNYGPSGGVALSRSHTAIPIRLDSWPAAWKELILRELKDLAQGRAQGSAEGEARSGDGAC